jgi:hypothetical protein
MAALPPKTQARSSAVVEVLAEGRVLESLRDQTLREFRDWLVSNRFHGSVLTASFGPPMIPTASWEQTHPGGFTVAPLSPLGRSY